MSGVPGGVRRAVFLDRDGVLNQTDVRNGKPYAPTRLEDFILLEGVAAAVARLREAGFLAIVATNQPDVATGKTSRETLDAMHRSLRAEVPVDDIRVCLHTDADNCACRKPKPGLLLDAAADFGIDLAASVMIGDRWRDIGAGKQAGCRTILVDRGYDEDISIKPDHVVADLPEAVSVLLDMGPDAG